MKSFMLLHVPMDCLDIRPLSVVPDIRYPTSLEERDEREWWSERQREEKREKVFLFL